MDAIAAAATAIGEAETLIAKCDEALADRSNPISERTILLCSTVAGLKMQYASMVLRLDEATT